MTEKTIIKVDLSAPYLYQEFPKWINFDDGSTLMVRTLEEELQAHVNYKPKPKKKRRILSPEEAETIDKPIALNWDPYTAHDRFKAQEAEEKKRFNKEMAKKDRQRKKEVKRPRGRPKKVN